MSLLDKEIQHLKRIYGTILRTAGAEALRFYKQRFDEQTWVDEAVRPGNRRGDEKGGEKP